ncbi:MAG: gamma-glutamyltransferase family protein [Thaumarchaeota archaeon]|nr:MAG: gamma-glutamyltransferase family protein [Nitrososphaerota archaeon]
MSIFTTRPLIMGTKAVVAAGHYLAAVAGMRILERGGNAIDSAAAIGLSLAVLEAHMNSIGGEVPMLIYVAKEERVVAVSGQGPAGLQAKIDWFKSRGIEMIPGDGFLPAVVPSVVGSWVEVLTRFGTMSFAQVAQPAIELAEDGYPLQLALRDLIAANAGRFVREWPTTARIFLPNSQLPEEGYVLRQQELAQTLRSLVGAERTSSHTDRGGRLDAVRREFYEGKIARKIEEFISKNEIMDATGHPHRGLLTYEDFARYKTRIEGPVSCGYRDFEIYKCGPWTQGPVFLQQIGILEGFDLPSLGHNSSDYIHLFVEAAKMAFADREKYYGDPDFDRVPLEKLLSKEYARKRGQEIDMNHARLSVEAGLVPEAASNVAGKTRQGDTTHLDAVDREGNMVSATQSGGWINSSPIIEGLGFALSTRGQMFFLDARRNNALAPGKRPRTTLTPSLAFRNGKPFMVFGTPGGDMQDQWSLQFFLNYAEFGMNLQQAIDAPSFHTLHFPSSFYPRTAEPGKIIVEGRIPSRVTEELRSKGHIVEETGDWENGRVSAVMRDSERGIIVGGASPKMIYGNTAYAIGW